MKLTLDESAALERRRQRMSDLGGFKGIVITDRDSSILADAMLRLFPPGHDAEITSERLVASGFTPHADAPHVLVNPPGHGDSLAFTSSYGLWSLPGEDRRLQSEVAPTNMGEVWQLMSRIGIEVNKP